VHLGGVLSSILCYLSDEIIALTPLKQILQRIAQQITGIMQTNLLVIILLLQGVSVYGEIA